MSFFHCFSFLKGALRVVTERERGHQFTSPTSSLSNLKPVDIKQTCNFCFDFCVIKNCSSWFYWFVPSPRCRKLKMKKKTLPYLTGCSRQRISPAECVGAAGASELQAIGLVPLLVGAGGNDCAAAAFGTRLIRARAEQQRVTQLPWDSLEELTQSLRHNTALSQELIIISFQLILVLRQLNVS